ncbi:DUF4433 domain-containing protein [Pseudobacteroides cellulosolvens]|uniref:DarT domain-containing protein n=1 Tax=Pseudobacteroides cellulosolvens ATCC 35603 = DSM 2933 TaxID=398512 RepID=A0A0L6JGF3_9FIRM|nr:DUF4433 domain-containing protein [Pseudobacteroides cellulosolvens]KNY24784.1 hypothetical protein Bccel_0041 [Pseudobacteroides cellulosolvens ATCC 35603 = DSM 2933]
MSAYDVLTARGVTRLCHFTKLQSLTHIVTSENGVLASSSIRQDTKNVNDTARYDGELNFVCCSVQYPNSWFLKKAMQNNLDKIFKDWVVLYVDLSILKYKNAKFCPCNASKSSGAYINGNMDNIDSIFATSVSTFAYPRSPKMLSSCPTDGQAEILIEDSIPREYINGLAVGNEDVAKRVYAILTMYGMGHIPLYIAPDVLTTNWSNMIKNGRRPDEIQCDWSEED